MIRNKTKSTGPIIIDLTSSEGNAFYLLALAKNLSKKLDMDYAQIYKEMTDSDYEWLINVFDSYFGDYVILER